MYKLMAASGVNWDCKAIQACVVSDRVVTFHTLSWLWTGVVSGYKYFVSVGLSYR